MKNLKLILTSLIVAITGVVSARTMTNYVNNALSDYTGHDGSTPALAFRTIQEGINNTEHSGTVFVAPGDYGDDQGVQTSDHGKSRIFINGRHIKLKSTDGAAVTFIRGKKDTSALHGFGDDAVRCVDIMQDGACSWQVVIEGFTLIDGSTADTQDLTGDAGAVLSTYTLTQPRAGSFAYGTYLIDCTIDNCDGALREGYLTQGCTHIRCRFQNITVIKAPSASNDAKWNGSGNVYLNCLFTGFCRRDPSTGELATGTVYWGVRARYLNCTFMDNQAIWWAPAPCYFVNCVDALSKWQDSDGRSTGNNGLSVNCYQDSTANRYTIAPSLGDYRLRAGTAPTTAGDPGYFAETAYFKAPPRYSIDIYKDIDGNAIPASGAIAVGCSQSTVTIDDADTYVIGADKYVAFGERTLPQRDIAWVYSTADQTSLTAQVCGHTDDGRIHTFLMNSARNYPNDYLNDRFTFVPLASGVTTIGYNRATATDADHKLIYVDAETEEATTTQTGAKDHPYKTMQQAISAAPNCGSSWGGKYAVIVAAAGTYDEGSGSVAPNGIAMKGRIAVNEKHIRFVSAEGPATTIITGEADPTGGAHGDNSLGLVVDRWAMLALQGFTMQDAWSHQSTYAAYGVISSVGSDEFCITVTDSILKNNHGHDTVFGGPCVYARCRFTGNTGVNGIFHANARVISSIADNNTITSGSGTFFRDVSSGYSTGFIYGSTIVGDGTHNMFYNISYCRFLNSIFTNGGPARTVDYNETFSGCVMSGFSPENIPSGALYVDDPLLLGTSGDDRNFRVLQNSAAMTAGAFEIESEGLRELMRLDYAGAIRKTSVAGAYMEAVSEGVYIANGDGFSVTGAVKGYNSDIADGATISLGLACGSTKPLTGFVIDGVTNLYTTMTPSIAFVNDAATFHTIMPIYGNAWYVDAANGDDTTGLGYNPACAWKTLAGAFTDRTFTSGDVLMAMPGVYNSGTMIQDLSLSIRARAVVPAGVTLKAYGSRAETIIEGAPCTPGSEDVSTSATYNDNMTGLGKDAIRGVYLFAGAKVEGFTIRNCYTRGCEDSGKDNHGGVDFSGAAVRTADLTALISDCTLEDCHAFRGGALYGATAANCFFTNNVALYAGGASSESAIYGSVSIDNRSPGNHRAGGHFYWRALENCTIFDSVNGCVTGNDTDHNIGVMKNCLVLANDYTWWVYNKGYPEAKNFQNCIFVPPVKPYDSNSGYVYGLITNAIAESGSVITTLDQVQVDSELRPVVGSSLAVDQCDTSLNSAYIGDKDAYGTQRIYNHEMDIGALEGDHRPAFAKAMSAELGNKSYVTVESATWDVYINFGTGEVTPSLVIPYLAKISFTPKTSKYRNGKFSGNLEGAIAKEDGVVLEKEGGYYKVFNGEGDHLVEATFDPGYETYDEWVIGDFSVARPGSIVFIY